ARLSPRSEALFAADGPSIEAMARDQRAAFLEVEVDEPRARQSIEKLRGGPKEDERVGASARGILDMFGEVVALTRRQRTSIDEHLAVGDDGLQPRRGKPQRRRRRPRRIRRDRRATAREHSENTLEQQAAAYHSSTSRRCGAPRLRTNRHLRRYTEQLDAP